MRIITLFDQKITIIIIVIVKKFSVFNSIGLYQSSQLKYTRSVYINVIVYETSY